MVVPALFITAFSIPFIGGEFFGLYVLFTQGTPVMAVLLLLLVEEEPDGAGHDQAQDGGEPRDHRELLLAALSACMIKGIERVVPILRFQLRGVEVRVDGVRQDVPPRLESIRYQIVVDTDESDHRLELLHENVRKYGTVFNTVSPGTDLMGTLVRKG